MVSLKIGIFCALFASSLAFKAGKDAIKAQFPHQISLRYDGQHVCGGAIIAEKWVVTAAHCILGTPDTVVKLYTVLAGSNSLKSGGTIVELEQIIVHQSFGKNKLLINDIALLKLSQSLIFSKNIESIKLCRKDVIGEDEAIISGWGGRYTHGSTGDNLQYFSNMLAFAWPTCTSFYEGLYYAGLLCIYPSDGDGACHGDSGGPAIAGHELIGVTSFSYGGYGSTLPCGYSEISYFRDWIRNETDLDL